MSRVDNARANVALLEAQLERAKLVASGNDPGRISQVYIVSRGPKMSPLVFTREDTLQEAIVRKWITPEQAKSAVKAVCNFNPDEPVTEHRFIVKG